MRTRWVAVLALLVAGVSVTACVSGSGQLGQGAMMGGQSSAMMGGQSSAMMGGQSSAMMGGQSSAMMGGQGGMMGDQSGMMGGQSGMMGGQSSAMMGGQDGGMMGQMMMGMMSGMPMMGSMMGYYSGVPVALSHDDARAVAESYLVSLDNPELEIDEFEEYSHNFYLSLVERSTGGGAIEIIIDRYSGSYQPEPQAMMWSSRYGMMGGSQQSQMTVTGEGALGIAQDFLDVAYPGTKADEIVAYDGYYTIMSTFLEGQHYGMLSVNGYSGDVWYHTWHGMFLSEIEQ